MDSIELKIGQKAKKLRQAKKMTLKELSEKTNLSIGYLSQFERGINTIALDSLSKIANVFGVELNYFFPNTDLSNDKSVVMRSYEQRFLDIIGNNYIVKLLSHGAHSHDLYPRMIEILPQSTSENIQSYGHHGEEFIYVLEGVLTLIFEGEKHLLYPGDSAHHLSTDIHNWSNDTNNIVKMLCVSIPNPFNKDAEE